MPDFSAAVKALAPWLPFSAWLGCFRGALMTYYNLDAEEGAPEPAISGSFNTIKGLADVAKHWTDPS
jgi:hypothetical protein